MANPAAVKLLGESSPVAIEGKRIEDVADGQLNNRDLLRKLTQAAESSRPFDGVELALASSGRVRLGARPLTGFAAEHVLVLVTLHAID
jgi:hypothetical protein